MIFLVVQTQKRNEMRGKIVNGMDTLNNAVIGISYSVELIVQLAKSTAVESAADQL